MDAPVTRIYRNTPVGDLVPLCCFLLTKQFHQHHLWDRSITSQKSYLRSREIEQPVYSERVIQGWLKSFYSD